MKRSLMAAAAMAVIASPALAAANGPYVGIEGGVTIPQSTHLDILNNTTPTPPTIVTLDNGYIVKNRAGWNVDVIAGYKLGLIRLEAEGGYQGSKINRVDVNRELPAAVGTAARRSLHRTWPSATGPALLTSPPMRCSTATWAGALALTPAAASSAPGFPFPARRPMRWR